LHANQPTPRQPTIVGLAIILREHSRPATIPLKTGGRTPLAAEVLITKRKPDAPCPGAWEFPGGKAYTGEHPRHTAAREAREEVGLTVTPVRQLPVLTHTYPHARVELHPWLCLAPSHAEPIPLDVADVRWVAAVELPVPGFLEGNTQIIAALRDDLAARGPLSAASSPPAAKP
jgi:mutator protein MutT